MQRTLVIIAMLLPCAGSAEAVSARYFFSTVGLSNPADPESPAVSSDEIQAAVSAGDPTVSSQVGLAGVRFYLWAMIPASPRTDLLGINIAFRADGDVQILRSHIWQNTNGFDDIGGFVETYRRWEDGGYPGQQMWNSRDADPTPTVAVLTDGVTNQAAADDDQRRNVFYFSDGQRAVLIGWLEVQGSAGEINIIHQGSGFLQIDPNNRIYLGLDNVPGFTLEFPPHDSSDFEARIGSLLGDMNCDGLVSVADISGFVLALTNPAGYAATFPHCAVNNADVNLDGAADVRDIGHFVALLMG